MQWSPPTPHRGQSMNEGVSLTDNGGAHSVSQRGPSTARGGEDGKLSHKTNTRNILRQRSSHARTGKNSTFHHSWVAFGCVQHWP